MTEDQARELQAARYADAAFMMCRLVLVDSVGAALQRKPTADELKTAGASFMMGAKVAAELVLKEAAAMKDRCN